MVWSYAIAAAYFLTGVIIAVWLAIAVLKALIAAILWLDGFTTRCPGLRHLRRWHRRRVYRPDRVVSRFVARDVRRDVLVVDATHVDEGVIAARIRTWNVLYARHGLTPAVPFGEVQTVELAELWTWTGAPWGGPVPKPATGTQSPNP